MKGRLPVRVGELIGGVSNTDLSSLLLLLLVLTQRREEIVLISAVP